MEENWFIVTRTVKGRTAITIDFVDCTNVDFLPQQAIPVAIDLLARALDLLGQRTIPVNLITMLNDQIKDFYECEEMNMERIDAFIESLNDADDDLPPQPNG